MFNLAAEALAEVKKDYGSGTPGQQGYIEGRILFEAATFVFGYVKLGKAPWLAEKAKFLAQLLRTKIPGRKMREALVSLSQVLRKTKMCFVAGTLVRTLYGLMKIEYIRSGMWVWSRDEVTGQMGWKSVVQTFTTRPSVLHHLTYEVRGQPEDERSADTPVRNVQRETLGVTAPHPFFVRNRETPGFIAAEELLPGDELFVPGHRQAVVASNTTENAPTGETFTTYNFEVEDFHTYFVGHSSVWVHNDGRGECEKIAAIYDYLRRNRIANGVQETPYETFIHMLDTLESSSNAGHQALFQAAYDMRNGVFNGRVLRRALKAMNDEMYALVKAGQLPMSSLPKMKDMKRMFPGLGTAGKPSPTDMHRHHLLEGRYYDRVLPHMSAPGRTMTPTAGDIPAYIVEQVKHTGAGGIAPELTKAIGTATDPITIYEAHVEVYTRLQHPQLLAVFEKWWSLHGLPRPLPPTP